MQSLGSHGGFPATCSPAWHPSPTQCSPLHPVQGQLPACTPEGIGKLGVRVAHTHLRCFGSTLHPKLAMLGPFSGQLSQVSLSPTLVQVPNVSP